jgi:hypothetical protein
MIRADGGPGRVRRSATGLLDHGNADRVTPKTGILFLIERDPERGFIARAGGHSIFMQAESEAELREMVGEAVHRHFEEERPNPIRLHFVRDEVPAA